MAIEILAQIALLSPTADALRVPLRAFPFVASLGLLFLVQRKHAYRSHPSLTLLCLGGCFLVGNFFNPSRNTVTAAVAVIAIQCAIAAPLLWVGRMVISETWLRRTVFLFWAFAFAGALAGVGQTLRPDWEWLQPNLSLVIQNFNDGGEGLKIALANGARVFRPMGLSDQPGGAAGAGLACIVFGIGLLMTTRNSWIWAAVMTSWGAGLYCILMSQVRSVLVMTGISVVAMTFIMWRRGGLVRMVWILGALALVVTLGAAAAVAVGGETVTGRLETLVAEDPFTVYMTNRGNFMEFTLKYAIWDHPLGAGLARWGMMNYYFGNPSDPNSETLWVEIMWTGWIYDGGIPLAVCYGGAMLVAIWQAWWIGTNGRNGQLGIWGAVVFAFDIGCLAVTFNYPLFAGQSGLDFWLINAALFAAEQHARAKAAPIATPAAPAPGSVARPSLPNSILGMHT